jgi:hypothetical protein
MPSQPSACRFEAWLAKNPWLGNLNSGISGVRLTAAKMAADRNRRWRSEYARITAPHSRLLRKVQEWNCPRQKDVGRVGSAIRRSRPSDQRGTGIKKAAAFPSGYRPKSDFLRVAGRFQITVHCSERPEP